MSDSVEQLSIVKLFETILKNLIIEMNEGSIVDLLYAFKMKAHISKRKAEEYILGAVAVGLICAYNGSKQMSTSEVIHGLKYNYTAMFKSQIKGDIISGFSKIEESATDYMQRREKEKAKEEFRRLK